MKLKFLFIICVVAGITACDDGIPENLEFDRFKKLYLSVASERARNISLAEGRDTTLVFGSVTYGGTTNAKQGNIEVEIGSELSLVQAYNQANKTKYEPLPAESFSFDITKLHIENGKKYSDVASLFISSGKLDVNNRYLLPVTIKSVTGNMAVNDEKKTAYWVFGFGGVEEFIQKDIYPLEFIEAGMQRIQFIQEDGFVTLKMNEFDPYINTAALGRPLQLSAGAHRVIAFEYKSNRTVTDAQFFYCVSGGAVGGRETPQNIVIPQASEWTRFEYDLNAGITDFGFGVDNRHGREPETHFLRFDLIQEGAGSNFEISLKNIQVEIFD